MAKVFPNPDYMKHLEEENRRLSDVELAWKKCELWLRANLFDGEERWTADADELRFKPSDLRETIIEMLEDLLKPGGNDNG